MSWSHRTALSHEMDGRRYPLLRVEGAARRLGVAEGTIRRRMRLGQISYVRLFQGAQAHLMRDTLTRESGCIPGSVLEIVAHTSRAVMNAQTDAAYAMREALAQGYPLHVVADSANVPASVVLSCIEAMEAAYGRGDPGDHLRPDPDRLLEDES